MAQGHLASQDIYTQLHWRRKAPRVSARSAVLLGPGHLSGGRGFIVAGKMGLRVGDNGRQVRRLIHPQVGGRGLPRPLTCRTRTTTQVSRIAWLCGTAALTAALVTAQC